MKQHEWKLADAQAAGVRRTARVRHVRIGGCALVGGAFGFALALLFVPLQLLWPLGAEGPGGLPGAAEAPQGFDASRYAWLIGFETFAGVIIGGALGLAFNLIAPLFGGLAFQIDLEREGTGDHALEPYEEQPVFEGR